jgi:hypothetical protein
MATNATSGKVKKFSSPVIRKITGGKDPVRIVHEFIVRRGSDPENAEKEKSGDFIRWILPISAGNDLEILVEGIKVSAETTMYLGVPIVNVPLKGFSDFLVSALEVADGLVGTKLSLVSSTLVLSATLAASGASVEELDYHFNLLVGQQAWFQKALQEQFEWVEEE